MVTHQTLMLFLGIAGCFTLQHSGLAWAQGPIVLGPIIAAGSYIFNCTCLFHFLINIVGSISQNVKLVA